MSTSKVEPMNERSLTLSERLQIVSEKMLEQENPLWSKRAAEGGLALTDHISASLEGMELSPMTKREKTITAFAMGLMLRQINIATVLCLVSCGAHELTEEFVRDLEDEFASDAKAPSHDRPIRP